MNKVWPAIVHTIYPVTIFEVLDDCLVLYYSETHDQAKIDKIHNKARRWYDALKKFEKEENFNRL
jgi:hypothetical protein